MSDLTDEQIVSRVQDGDTDAFSLLVDRYSQRLLNYVFRMIRNRDDAEDLLQDIFIRIYSTIQKYDKKRLFKPWMYKIATNICIDYSRKKKNVISLNKEYISQKSITLMETIIDPKSNPEQDIIDQEILRVLNKAIDGLPKKQREAFMLFHFEQFSYKEIAEALSIPMGTVKSRLFNAYEKVYFSVKKEDKEWGQRILIALFMSF